MLDAADLLEIAADCIVDVNVLVEPPVWPSNTKLVALTSPASEKVVTLLSFAVLPAVPLTLPVTLPVKLPVIRLACNVS